jgi:hypothetical protein
MRLLVCCLSVVVLFAASAPARAQGTSTPTPTSVVTYYRCAQGDSARADAIVKEHFVPFLKAEQAAGHISGYGWSEHVEGGEWRRVLYMSGTSLDTLLDSRDALVKLTQSADHAKAFEEFGRICPSHDDYIWRSKSTSQSPADVGRVRGPFTMSTYYACGPDEAEADALVASTLAPVLNARVKDGSIMSWNWMEHLIGGQYRRLLIVDGKDEKSLLRNWAALHDEAEKAAPALTHRLEQICHSHADYIWKRAVD